MSASGSFGLWYCGGCNPQIDRKALAEAIRGGLPRPWHLTTEEGDAPWETALLLCGCPTACADRPKVRALARHWILVAGKTVDAEEVSEAEIVERVMKKLEPLLRRGHKTVIPKGIPAAS